MKTAAAIGGVVGFIATFWGLTFLGDGHGIAWPFLVGLGAFLCSAPSFMLWTRSEDEPPSRWVVLGVAGMVILAVSWGVFSVHIWEGWPLSSTQTAQMLFWAPFAFGWQVVALASGAQLCVRAVLRRSAPGWNRILRPPQYLRAPPNRSACDEAPSGTPPSRKT